MAGKRLIFNGMWMSAVSKRLSIRQNLYVNANGRNPSCSKSLATISAHRISAENPAEFSLRNEAQWYKVHDEDFKAINLQEKLPLTYIKQTDTFLECCFMVRKPFLEVANCMKHMNPDQPINRVVLYGKPGTGKSISLNQTLHHGFKTAWTLVYVPSVIKWNHSFQEISMSTWKAGRIDLPLEAAEWLQDFKRINVHLANVLKEVTTGEAYEWSKRESTPEGSPLMDIVDNGINRVRYATDCVGVLLKELKRNASLKNLKVLVMIDEANSLWQSTAISREDKSLAPATDVALNIHFSSMLRNDWRNGLAVVCTDQKEVEARALAVTSKKNKKRGLYLKHLAAAKQPVSFLPYFLLGKEGFDVLDPFIPVETGKYTEKEMRSCLDYFFEKNWIQTPGAESEEGRKQLAHLSDYNPNLLERLCASW